MPDSLNFHFTPVDKARPDEENVHAKASTDVTDVIKAIQEKFPEAVTEVVVYAGEHTVFIAGEFFWRYARH